MKIDSENMTEDMIQIEVIKWSKHPAVQKKYPELALLYHTANEWKCSVYRGAHLKRMGVKSGVPDLHLPVPRKGFHGLYIELKSAKGRVSDNQKWWLEHLTRQGNMCRVCHSVNETIDLLEEYLTSDKEN